ncbi:MAG: hypothetical protein HY531_00590 [Chloroflexi bacterium]|nr:hypothetical protein [Chloroflexota bacterium]
MSNRYQREIEEILDKIGSLPPGRERPARRRGFWPALSAAGRFLRGPWWHLSPGRIMLGTVVLLLVALLFKASMPGLVAPIAWIAVFLFVLGYALFFINPQPYERRWRGQPVETGPGLWQKLLRWLKFK